MAKEVAPSRIPLCKGDMRWERVLPHVGKSPRLWKHRPISTGTESRKSARSCASFLADVFALYLKTKNFHWHMSGPHFRDYHLLLDEQSDQIFAMTDDIAERARKIGGITLHSISEIAREQRLSDNNDEFVAPADMLAELADDNQTLVRSMRATHEVCDRAQRRRHGQHARELDRRDRTADLVLVGKRPVNRSLFNRGTLAVWSGKRACGRRESPPVSRACWLIVPSSRPICRDAAPP